MKKIVSYLSLMAIVAFLASCDLNQTPVFNDSDRFVAFDAASYSALETAGALKIPVRLTSLGSSATAVSFALFDGTAVSGRDYQLSGGASVLNFDGSDPVQYINVNILGHVGVFTGDRKFGISISSATNGVNIGGMDTTYVTILDTDHPLAALLGNYTVFGPNYFSGRPDTWTVTLEKDPGGDVTKVWISNFVVSGTNQKIYGVVNADKNKIDIPVGQTIATSTSYNSIVLEGFDDPNVDNADLLPAGSKLTMNLVQSSPVKFVISLPFGSHIVDVDSWYSIVKAGATFTKQ